LFITGTASIVFAYEWAIDAWRVFVLVSVVPIVLASVGAFFVEESPAWLQDMGRNDEALAVLRRAASANGKDLGNVALIEYQREEEPSMRELFTPNLIRRTMSLSTLWLLGLFGYYGASLANTFIFESSEAINYGAVIFAGCGEMAGVILAILVARRWSGMKILGTFASVAAVGCLAILATTFMDDVPKQVIACFAFMLRLGCMASSGAVWVVTPPAFPTYVRSTAHSFLFGVGRIGGLCATLWPSTTPVAVIMGAYAIANTTNAFIAFFEGSKLEQQGVFESLAADLRASSVLKRARSLHASAAARLEGTDDNRLSAGSKSNLPVRHSLPPMPAAIATAKAATEALDKPLVSER